MSVVVAIETNLDRALLVSSDISPAGEIVVKSVNEVVFPTTEEMQQLESSSDKTKVKVKTPMLDELVGLDVESSLAVISENNVLIEKLHLPFDDSKKLEKTVPIQIQDLLPFEIDQMLIDNVVLGKTEDNQFEIASALIPADEVAELILKLKKIGSDPKHISTKTSSITGLSSVLPELNSNCLLIYATRDHFSLAIYVQGKISEIRDLKIAADLSIEKSELSRVAFNILTSIAKAERQIKQKFNNVYLIGDSSFKTSLEPLIHKQIKQIDLNSRISKDPSVEFDLNQIPWAIGLTIDNQNKQKNIRSSLINFRTGNFAYRPTFGNLLAAVREEKFYLLFALIALVVWGGVIMISNVVSLTKLNNFITSETQKVFPTEKIIPGREVLLVEQKLSELESTMSELNILSSLSALQVIKKLSSLVDNNINIEIRELNISQEEIKFTGSVSDSPTLGRLQTLLENNEGSFCDISVSTPGIGAGKVPFEVSMTFCN